MAQKKIKLRENQIQECLQNDAYDFGNDLLYDLCRNYPLHNETGIVICKILFIGRIYAAAIERVRSGGNKKIINDDFYRTAVASSIIKSDLDKKLNSLKRIKDPEKKINMAISVHKDLVTLFSEITKSDSSKRSLASKYLHFHLPNLFYIYDSRSKKALARFECGIPNRFEQVLAKKEIGTTYSMVDKEYALFFLKCLDLKEKINRDFKLDITPRQIDNLLINEANVMARKKKNT